MSAHFAARLAALTLGAFVAASCGGQTEEAAADGAGASDAGASETAGPRSAFETAADMALGDPAAPVTIVEYASATCSHCASFHADVFKPLKEKYVDTGQVRFVFREFPLDGLALAGFLVARCVAEDHGPDGYFAFIDALFRQQKVWAFGDDPRGELLKLSAEAGVDETEFDACVQDQDEIDRIRNDIETAQAKYEIKGTPAFVINGDAKPVRTLEQFDEALAPLLAAE